MKGEGGLAAEQAAEQDYPFYPEMKNGEAANLDLNRLVEKFSRGHRRRASPRWSMPTDIWGLLMACRAQRRDRGERTPIRGPLLQEFTLAQLRHRFNAWNVS
eukprot:9495491-Pyramimonas_sp.AAC.1